MSNNKNQAINGAFRVEEAFEAAISRLKVQDFMVSVGSDTYPVSAITHQYVFLPKIALRAEELSVLLFGKRLFPSLVYTVKSNSASGFALQQIDGLTDAQREDPNFLSTIEVPAADEESITEGLKSLVIDLAVLECFSVDREKKLISIKELDMTIHKAFKITADYEDGQCIPLLTAEYLSANELHAMAKDNAPIIALNKARRVAEELSRDLAGRDDEYDMDAGV